MFDVTHIELSKSAIDHNIKFLRRRVGKNVRISSVVKGNAYGHGIEEYVPLVNAAGIDHFSVFSASEAERVQKVVHTPHDLIIMGEVSGDAIEWAIQNEIEFYVFDVSRLEEAIKFSKKLNKPAKIHIELETGMNRTGFDAKELDKVSNLLIKHPEYLIFQGLCTHFAGAESIANYLRIQRQIRRFKSGSKHFSDQDLHPVVRHTCCSAAMMMFPKSRYDLVRVGIMQYGFWPSPETFIQYVSDRKSKEDPLKRVISWKSKVMAVKEVRSGEFIGYGQSFLARENMRTAVVPVGYGDGYSRDLSNLGRLLIGGKRVAVVGLVNMNMLVADISQVEDVKPGDEVVLVGNQQDMELTVGSFAELSHQLNYELLTRLPAGIPRKITD